MDPKQVKGLESGFGSEEIVGFTIEQVAPPFLVNVLHSAVEGALFASLELHYMASHYLLLLQPLNLSKGHPALEYFPLPSELIVEE